MWHSKVIKLAESYGHGEVKYRLWAHEPVDMICGKCTSILASWYEPDYRPKAGWHEHRSLRRLCDPKRSQDRP